jgi:hypothetical protein
MLFCFLTAEAVHFWLFSFGMEDPESDEERHTSNEAPWTAARRRRFGEGERPSASGSQTAFRPSIHSQGGASFSQARGGEPVVDSDAGGKDQSRPPTLEDLLHLCRELNSAGAKYIVIGGMAVIRLGFVRATEDIDLLIDSSPGNQLKIRQALMALPDQAVREMTETDLDHYQVIKVADEIVVDLMKSACGIAYPEASRGIEWDTVEGVRIPFASAELLWKMKQAPRAKDEIDRSFLRAFLGIEDS